MERFITALQKFYRTEIHINRVEKKKGYSVVYFGYEDSWSEHVAIISSRGNVKAIDGHDL